MEVVVLLVAIVGVALIVIPRIQRRKAGGHRPVSVRKRRSTPAVAAAAVPAAAWAPSEPGGPDAWEDDLGWEGEGESVAQPAPKAREAWEDWRAAALPASPPPTEPEVRELPSVERWRARAEEDDWAEDDDDGLGWEGEDAAPAGPALWNGAIDDGPTPAGWSGDSQGFESSRDWSRSAEPAAAAAPPSAPAFATASATDLAAPTSDPESGRSRAVESDVWDPPITRTWGAASTADSGPAAPPRASGRRAGSARSRVHPVLLVAVYAAVGIGLVVLLSTVLLGGSADPKPAAKKQPAVPQASATPSPVAAAEPVATPDPAIAAAAATDFKRERAKAERSHKAALANALAAAKREAKAKKARANRNKNNNTTPPPSSSNGGGGGSSYTPPVATYTPPSNPVSPAPKPKKRSVCEFCIG
jgi:hypothetical protein